MKKILLSSAIAVLFFVGCTEEKPQEQVQEEVKQESVKKAEETTKSVEQESTKEAVTKAATEVKDTVSKAATDISKSVSDATSKVIENTSKTVDESMPKVKETVNKTVEETKKAIDEVKKETNKIIASATGGETKQSSVDGKALFATCVSCHGQNGEKKALNASAVIQGWDKQKVIDALNGYKDGSYGGAMKGVMKGQVATKTQEEIEALAEYISKL